MPFPLRPTDGESMPAASMPAASMPVASMPAARHAAAPQRTRTAVRLSRVVGVPLLLAALVTAGSPGWMSYRIRNGDTLSEIASRYHTTVAKLVQVNGLQGNGDLIYAGTTIKVPGRSSARPTTSRRHHRVVQGDTLSGIAARYHVRPEAIAKANRLPSSLIVRLGDTLVIPGVKQASSRSSSNTFAGRTYPDSTVSAADRNRAILARRNLPSREHMRDLIVSISRANGVDPALALAISWQEAGWAMHHVSVANAIGAMQVIPSTGEWVSQVIGRRLNLLNPRDNVTAGVVLLRILDRAAANERQAIAGYYQGLQSVRDNGMFADTKRYVANIQTIKRWYD